MCPPIITLTTDFGLRDPYVAEMKAVILSISPKVTIVDISHEIEKFNVQMGAYVLASASPYFPKNTIHVAIIDPGVGTKRRSILIEANNSFFIGPDNGLLTLAAENQGIQHVYEMSNRRLMLSKVSATFHGRDVFAPAAAHLANGTLPSEFDKEIRRIVTPSFAKPVKREGVLVGEVMHIDGFGNIITNISEKELQPMKIEGSIKIKIGEERLTLKFCKAYADAEPLKLLALVGSHNFLEISINQGNAAKTFKVNMGDKITLHSL